MVPGKSVDFGVGDVATDDLDAPLVAREGYSASGGNRFAKGNAPRWEGNDFGEAYFAQDGDDRVAGFGDEDLVFGAHDDVLGHIPFVNQLVEIDGDGVAVSNHIAFEVIGLRGDTSFGENLVEPDAPVDGNLTHGRCTGEYNFAVEPFLVFDEDVDVGDLPVVGLLNFFPRLFEGEPSNFHGA